MNADKSTLEPSQSFAYLGLVLGTVAWMASVKPEREDRIRSNAKQLLAVTSATCRAIAVFLGRTNSTAGAIPLARARTRHLQWDFIMSCTSPNMYDNYMELSAKVKTELGFWAKLPPGLSLPITLGSAQATVTSDASETGSGILYEGSVISEIIPERFREFHINVKQLCTLYRFLDLLWRVITWDPIWISLE